MRTLNFLHVYEKLGVNDRAAAVAARRARAASRNARRGRRRDRP